ncbi:MAG: sigma-70 family RNA polymerase sigma factor [Phycisphaerales bacterium]|nr:MAG: sigma-70 family RNA polymerase sigma factor [Phycisphaerales bacterium]
MQDPRATGESGHGPEKPTTAADGAGVRQSDADLIRRLRGGDADALRVLMKQYDRLVRYTVFRACRDRCVRDPDWLDARASETWTGFLRSVQAPGAASPEDLRAYLVQVARHKCRDALRLGRALAGRTVSQDEADLSQLVVEEEDAPDTIARLEDLEALRASIDALPPEDRVLCAEFALIVERKWKQAAKRLGIAESSLRSRWPRVLQRLRAQLGKKSEKLPRDPPAPPTL